MTPAPRSRPKLKRETTTPQGEQVAQVAPPASAAAGLKKRRSPWPESEEDFKPRPAHFRYLRAYAELLDEGGQINMAAIARRMGISPQAFWVMRQRCAGLDRWVAEQLGRKNALYAEPIIRKLAAIALRGSVDHAKLYFQVTGKLGPNDTGAGAAAFGPGPTVVNIVVPRPGDAPVSASPFKLGGGTS